jgi:hypothetical protein
VSERAELKDGAIMTSPMIRAARVLALCASFAVAEAAGAAAQSPGSKLYADVNVAGQTQSVTLATSSSVALFDELATTSASQTVGKGLVFDIGAGYRVHPNVAVGVAFSRFSRSPTGTITVSVPDPIVYGAFTALTAAPKLNQTELGTHVKVSYLSHITDKFDLTVSAGPSFVRLSKDIIGGTLTGGTPTITVATQTASGLGVNGGADLNYFMTTSWGVGLFARYVAASVDLPAASGVKVGGFQGGLGLRVRF